MSIWLAFLPMTEPRLGRALAAALRDGGHGDYAYDERARTVAVEGGASIHLGNLVLEMQAAPFYRRPAFLRSIVAAFSQPPAVSRSFEEVEDHILVRVRDRLYLEMMRLQAPEVRVVSEVLAEHFAVSLAVDSEHAVSEVTQDDLDRWGKTFDELVALGRRHLLDATDPPRFVELSKGLHRSAYQDVYDASRVLLPGVIRTLPVTGAPVVTLPNRNTLLVAGADDPAALRRLVAETDRILETEPRPQSGRCLVLDGTTWVPFMPSDPTVRAEFVARERIEHARTCNEHRALLLEQFERSGRDAFVPEVTVLRTPAGETFSYVAWVEGVDDAVMSEADCVTFVFGAAGDQFLRVPWQVVVTTLAHRLESLGGYPVRYQLSTFPSAEELHTLRAHALD